MPLSIHLRSGRVEDVGKIRACVSGIRTDVQNPHCSHRAELSNWTLAVPSLGWLHLHLGLVPNQMI